MVKMSLKTMLDEADDMVGIQNGRACENTTVVYNISRLP